MANRHRDEPTDVEVIANVLAGDVDCFELLVRRYQARMLRTARLRLGDAMLAEDAVQDAFVAIYRGLKTYDSKYSFQTWVWAILINECRRKYKRSMRAAAAIQVSTEEHPDALIATESRPQVLLNEEIQRVIMMLQQINEVEAEAVRLRFFDEMKYADVAKLMGCSLATAKNRVRRGLEKLSRLVVSTDELAKDQK